MPDKRRVFGNASERLAEAYLTEHGYCILDRQFSIRQGEIDLIAEHKGEIVFVEVKARHTDEFGYPEEAVTRSKLNKIAQAAEIYLRRHNLTDRPFRVDVVAIEHYIDPPRITVIEGVG